MNFINHCLKSAAFSLQTSENNLKPPKNNFKRQINVQQWFTTRGSYVHKIMVTFSGASQKLVSFFAIFSFLEIVMVSDKTIHKPISAFTIHKNKTH